MNIQNSGPNFRPPHVLGSEIGKHQTDVVMVLSILDTQTYNNYILPPFICAGQYLCVCAGKEGWVWLKYAYLSTRVW